MKQTSLTLSRQDLINDLRGMIDCLYEDFLETGDPSFLDEVERFRGLFNMSSKLLARFWADLCEHCLCDTFDENPDITDLLLWDDKSQTKVWVATLVDGKFKVIGD